MSVGTPPFSTSIIARHLADYKATDYKTTDYKVTDYKTTDYWLQDYWQETTDYKTTDYKSTDYRATFAKWNEKKTQIYSRVSVIYLIWYLW